MNESEEETQQVTSSNDDNSRDLELSSAEEAEKYYNNYSEAWQRKVNGIINTYSNIHHPTKANHSQCNLHSEKFSSNIMHKSPFNYFTVCYVITNWKCHKLAFPSCIFTTTINGRTGNNACTFIALVLSKLHFAAPELPRTHHPLCLTWVFRMVQGMEIGNIFYDSHSAGDPVIFGVREAVQKVQASLGIASVRSELPADITRQPVATANLPHHTQLASLLQSLL